MCGITGIFDTRGERAVSHPALHRMNNSKAHRRPDEGSLHIEPGLGFGHRRLSIIDVAAGQQPIFSEDGSVALIYNSEICNLQELAPELQAAGHRFRTKSDSEVIFHAWEQWGEACVECFRGMFAFALWDRNRQTLFLARDRLGVKPMYYALLDDGMLLFGSELKSLLAHRDLRHEIDPLAIEEYLALGYVAEPRTVVRQARKLPPAHTLAIRCGQPVGERKEYWDVSLTLDNPIGVDDACAELRERLAETVRLRLISEVPLGAFLSRGVDSSAVVATMAGLQDGPVNTCSIALADPQFDEATFAQQVATRYATNYRIETVKSDDFDLIDTLARQCDEPYADSSAIPTYRVCQLARKHVTVALSGDGGDESFGGYRRYRLHLMEERMRAALPLALRRPLIGLLGRMYRKADWAPRVLRAKTTVESMSRTAVQAYLHSMSILRGPLRERLFSEGFQRQLAGYSAEAVFDRHAALAGTDDPLGLVQYLDLKTNLVGDINTKVDHASMAHSLEVCEPLMDHPLVEWLATLPSSLKVRAQEGKFLLKKAMEPKLSADILDRPKMGFSVPLARWFRGPLRQRVRGGPDRPAAGRQRLVRSGQSSPDGRLAPVRPQRPQRGDLDASDARSLPARRRRRAGRGAGARRGRVGARRMTLRILRVLDHSISLHSGYTFRTAAILREQRARGWQTFHLAGPKQMDCAVAEEEVGGLHFFRTDADASDGKRVAGITELQQMRRLRERIDAVARRVMPDLIHAHWPVLGALPALFAGRKLGIPVVHEVRAFWEDAAVDHGTTTEGSLRYRLTQAMETHALKRAAHVFTFCKGLRRDIVGRGIRPERVTVIPNAVDIESFAARGQPEAALKERLGLAGSTVIGFIGSFYAYEGLDLLIDALPILLERSADVRLLLEGGGAQEGALKAQAQRLGVADKVVFTGRVAHDEVQRYCDVVDVLAYPRHSMRLTEPVTPLKPLEAMAQERLLVASDGGGHRELITDSKTGRLLPAGSVRGLVDALVTTLENPAEWPRERAAARRFVERERSWPRSGEGYAGPYEAVAGSRVAWAGGGRSVGAS